jgi:HK97 family phage major capsid protein
MTLEELRALLADLNQQSEAIVTKAETEHRDLTDDEQKQVDELLAKFDSTRSQIQRLERLEEQRNLLTAGRGRQTTPGGPGDQPRISGGTVRNDARNTGTHGFRGMGEFAQAVRAASLGHGVDPRLGQEQRASLSTYGNEGVGADGGFAAPPDYRDTIVKLTIAEDPIINRTSQMPITRGNTMVLPLDETTPWGTAGVQGYWEGEAAAATQSKPVLKTRVSRLSKVTALVPVTEELLEDSAALEAWLMMKAPEVLQFKVNDAIVNGDGVGKPLGIIASGARVSVAKESGQAADTIVSDNIIKMWARLYGPSQLRAVWLINQDTLPQLMTMKILIKNAAGSENVGGWPLYLPANSLSGSPFSTLMGRPVIPLQSCPTVGDEGDIILADLAQYLTTIKSGGIRNQTSIHLWFDQGVTAYRWTMRVDGAPMRASTITPKNGSSTLSSFVTLAARA